MTLPKLLSSDQAKPNHKCKVLHICRDFANQQIYTQLVSHLAKEGISQIIYAAVRTVGESKWTTKELVDIEHHLRHILRPYDKVFFRIKIRKIVRDLCTQVDLSQIGLIHAHFLYSDGAVALKLKQEMGIPYIVTVRNADLNYFMRYRPDLCFLRDEILREASQLVFMSPTYSKQFCNRISKSVRKSVECKSIVVPNGIEKSWLQEFSFSPIQSEKILRLLYVGDFSKNKNIPGLIRAVHLLSVKRPVHLTLVGGGRDGEVEVEKMLASGKYKFIEYKGRITDKEKLKSIYRQHDLFIMPSFKETFGVVYIEALSQGLPIIHSRGQGVDGYFESHTVSEAVEPDAPTDIAMKIEVLAARCPSIRQACIVQAKEFDWMRIASKYKKLYHQYLLPVMH